MHLAAQAGVRYSLTNPHAYVDSNVIGFLNILEACRHRGAEHLVYASSSSVYGANTAMPFSVHHNVDHPVSLYAATKKANELMAHTYSHLFGIPTTGLRFFTVYGPWGRPDMAALPLHPGDPRGPAHRRVQPRATCGATSPTSTTSSRAWCGCSTGCPRPTRPGPATPPTRRRSAAPYRLYNIGNNSPVELMDFIGAIEKALGRKAELNLLPMQPGDVPATYADVDDLVRDVGFSPRHADRRRHRALRRLVPEVLRGLTRGPDRPVATGQWPSGRTDADHARPFAPGCSFSGATRSGGRDRPP